MILLLAVGIVAASLGAWAVLAFITPRRRDLWRRKQELERDRRRLDRAVAVCNAQGLVVLRPDQLVSVVKSMGFEVISRDKWGELMQVFDTAEKVDNG